MRRRVALARALAAVSGQPDGVLLLDEPFTGLDENNKALSAALVAAHRPGLVLLVTHDLQEAAALGAQVFAVQGAAARSCRKLGCRPCCAFFTLRLAAPFWRSRRGNCFGALNRTPKTSKPAGR